MEAGGHDGRGCVRMLYKCAGRKGDDARTTKAGTAMTHVGWFTEAVTGE
jgi:hypothetical protein